jgi:hypothetical protein
MSSKQCLSSKLCRGCDKRLNKINIIRQENNKTTEISANHDWLHNTCYRKFAKKKKIRRRNSASWIRQRFCVCIHIQAIFRFYTSNIFFSRKKSCFKSSSFFIFVERLLLSWLRLEKLSWLCWITPLSWVRAFFVPLILRR